MSMLPTVAVKAAIIAEFGVKAEAFISVRRHRRYARPRQLAMWFCRQSGRSFAQIGSKFGGRDHTTVIHACTVMDRLIAEDPDWREHANNIARRLGMAAIKKGEDERGAA